MDTLVATPDYPEDKCMECAATLMFHIDHPHGVHYVRFNDPWIKPTLDPDGDVLKLNHIILTCYSFKHSLFGDSSEDS